jgi:hypothetical protein
MSGVAVLRALMIASSGLTNIVPSTNIMAGTVPIKSRMPWIALEQTSLEERITVTPDAAPLQTERVTVRIYSNTYPQQKTIKRLIEAACPQTRGLIAGVTVDSIFEEAEGPDEPLTELNIVAQVKNYTVRFTE